MSAIGKGDWVECISSAGPDSYGVSITCGRIYCVERLDRFDDVPGNPEGLGLKLVGVGDHYCLWQLKRFRPMGGLQRITAPPIRAREDA